MFCMATIIAHGGRAWAVNYLWNEFDTGGNWLSGIT
jgi:hypothetical protein